MNAKRTGRPVGFRIREACEIVERCGPCDYRIVRAWMDDPAVHHNASKYCSRAVEMGLMTATKDASGANLNTQYSVVPNWREVMEWIAMKPIARVKKSRWFGVSSVWGMAA